jgi:hypothetical protein
MRCLDRVERARERRCIGESTSGRESAMSVLSFDRGDAPGERLAQAARVPVTM